MKLFKVIFLLAAMSGVSACETPLWEVTEPDKTVDTVFDSKPLSELVAGIWIDPNGCDHWIVDDGAEGYLSPRVDKYGKPVCSGTAPPNTAVGPFKNGAGFSD